MRRAPATTSMNASTPQRDVTDPGRLAALDALDILDTPAEQGFEDAVRLASRLCAVPVALVSLVGADRQWFKARRNFPPCETDLERSVCRFALGEHDLLVIPDLTLDPRTAANALVTGEPGIRFYAGAPLRLSNGHVVGSLCVIDTLPRPEGLTVEQAEDLRALGRQVVGLLEARRAATEAEAGTVRERAAQVSALAHAEESEAQNVALRASDERGRLAQEAGGVGLFEVDVVTGTMQVTPSSVGSSASRSPRPIRPPPSKPWFCPRTPPCVPMTEEGGRAAPLWTSSIVSVARTTGSLDGSPAAPISGAMTRGESSRCRAPRAT